MTTEKESLRKRIMKFYKENVWTEMLQSSIKEYAALMDGLEVKNT